MSLDVSDKDVEGPNLAGLTLVARSVVQLNLGVSERSRYTVHPAKNLLHTSLLLVPQSSFEVEERRRLFWMAYVLDRYAAMVWGSPFIIQSEEANGRLPSRYDLFVSNACADTEDISCGMSNSLDYSKNENLGSFSHHCKFAAFMTRV